MSFFKRLMFETREARAGLAAVPQIRDGIQGRISLDTYVAYLTQAYHHVKHTVPLMETAKSRLDSEHARFAVALDEYIAEETGHEEWVLNDIRHCGADAEAVRHGAPSPATEAMTDYVYDYLAQVNPMGFFGMVLVLEGTSVQLATQGASAVAKSLGLGARCFTYLSSHGALDQEHMAFFQRLMDEVDRPEDQAAIIEVAQGVFARFAEMFRTIPHDVAAVQHVA